MNIHCVLLVGKRTSCVYPYFRSAKMANDNQYIVSLLRVITVQSNFLIQFNIMKILNTVPLNQGLKYLIKHVPLAENIILCTFKCVVYF